MAVYYKPQSPIQSGEDFIYPLTTSDQVMVDENTRLNAVGVYLKNIDNSTDTTVYGNNATTLGGVAAEDYALKTDTAPDSNKLGGVTASGYALKTDTAPDSAKLGGKAPEYYLQPRNLLDNSDFTNPVNQRSFVSGNTVTAWSYFIDRWLVSDNDACVLMDTDGLQPPIADNAWVSQRIEASKFHEGETYTFAVGLSDGSVITVSGIFPTGETDWTIFAFSENENISIRQAKFTNGHNFCQIAAKTNVTVRWAALYEGSYTADTLPPYVPKGYVAELAECQRYYYQSFPGSSPTMTSGMIVCEAITAYKATNVFFPQIMRIEKPTVTVYSPFSGNVGKASEYVSETEVDAKAGHRSGHRFMLQSDSSSFEIGKHYCIHYTASADL